MLSETGVNSIRKGSGLFGKAGLLQNVKDFLFLIGFRKGHIFTYGIVREIGLLKDGCLMSHELPPVHILRINSIDPDCPGGRQIEAGHELHQSALPGPVDPDQGNLFTGGNGKRDIVQYLLLFHSRIGERDMVEFNRNFFKAFFRNFSGIRHIGLQFLIVPVAVHHIGIDAKLGIAATQLRKPGSEAGNQAQVEDKALDRHTGLHTANEVEVADQVPQSGQNDPGRIGAEKADEEIHAPGMGHILCYLVEFFGKIGGKIKNPYVFSCHNIGCRPVEIGFLPVKFEIALHCLAIVLLGNQGKKGCGQADQDDQQHEPDIQKTEGPDVDEKTEGIRSENDGIPHKVFKSHVIILSRLYRGLYLFPHGMIFHPGERQGKPLLHRAREEDGKASLHIAHLIHLIEEGRKPVYEAVDQKDGPDGKNDGKYRLPAGRNRNNPGAGVRAQNRYSYFQKNLEKKSRQEGGIPLYHRFESIDNIADDAVPLWFRRLLHFFCFFSHTYSLLRSENSSLHLSLY